MARARSGGGAYAMALVVLGCFFVIALLFAIIFYTKIEKAELAAAGAEAELAKYVSPSETPEASALIGDDGSVFSKLSNQITTLDNQNKSLTSERNEALQTATDANAQFEIRDDRVKQLESELATAQETLLATQQQHTTDIDQLRTQMVALEGERDQLQRTVDVAIRNANDGAQQRIETLNTQLATAQGQINELNDTIRELERFKILYQEGLNDNVVETRVTTADGEVASVFNQGDTLFINRGRNQGVMLGLSFEVFEPGTVIRLDDGTSQLRGKATVEVFEVNEETATCRVIRRTRNAMIDPGDPIANIVYDPNKTYTFYAFGDFDIDQNGGPNDIGRVQNLVTNWSGKVAELEEDAEGLPILVPEVDYLILGKQPEFPVEPDRDIIDPVVIREWQEKVKEYEIYQKLVDEAKSLRIPILNQNRFLDLIGYYQR